LALIFLNRTHSTQHAKWSTIEKIYLIWSFLRWQRRQPTTQRLTFLSIPGQYAIYLILEYVFDTPQCPPKGELWNLWNRWTRWLVEITIDCLLLPSWTRLHPEPYSDVPNPHYEQ
jgi:hypothetical protein